MNPRLIAGIGTLVLATGGFVAWSYRPSTRLNWSRIDPTLEPTFMKDLRLKQTRDFKGGRLESNPELHPS